MVSKDASIVLIDGLGHKHMRCDNSWICSFWLCAFVNK